MCGLYGFVTKKGSELSHPQKMLRQRIVTELGMKMQIRGDDSAGIGFEYKGKIHTFKKASRFDFLRKTKWYEEFTYDTRFVIGHTRAATMGAVTIPNSHPFIKGQTVGAHNGMVSNWFELNKEVSVDSEVIFEVLDKQRNPQEAFPLLDGSMALTWKHSEDENIHLVAHNNPLAYIEIPMLQTIFWCSTMWSLEQAIESFFGKKLPGSVDLPEDIVHTIKPDLSVEVQKVAFKKKAFPQITQLVKEIFGRNQDSSVSFKDRLIWSSVNDGCAQCEEYPSKLGFFYDDNARLVICADCARLNQHLVDDLEWIEMDYFNKVDAKILGEMANYETFREDAITERSVIIN